jgi:hypothetical protein
MKNIATLQLFLILLQCKALAEMEERRRVEGLLWG